MCNAVVGLVLVVLLLHKGKVVHILEKFLRLRLELSIQLKDYFFSSTAQKFLEQILFLVSRCFIAEKVLEQQEFGVGMKVGWLLMLHKHGFFCFKANVLCEIPHFHCLSLYLCK